jgi:hypothetical protein
MTSYEEVLTQITAIPNGVEGRDRTIQWLSTSQIVGAARDHLGHVELFLTGLALQARTKTVRDALHHHSWHREHDAPLEANRILLPAFGYYDQVGAFIATELLREGADCDLPRAFALTEPILELAIKRLQLSRSALLGLAGELLVLDAVFRHAEEQYVGQLVQAWDGWRRSSRDFSWDGTGVEIKTTTGRSSSHTVQGMHQIEPLQPTDDINGEDRLLLVSVGLQLSEPSANSFTLPQLTQRLVERMEATGNGGAVAGFLANVASYGSESGFGYHHTTMSNDVPFTTPFTPAFVRCYEMGDPAVEVLRRDDVLNHHHVDAQSVTFKINLPATLSADNPVSGIHRVAAAILGGEPRVH